jgi:pyruvate,water dikinase
METQSVITHIKSGLSPLDRLLQGLRPGDNVVWQADYPEDYAYFARALVEQAAKDGFECLYFNFAPGKTILEPQPGLTIIRIDTTLGFDYCTGEIHRIIREHGGEVFYIFDNLSDLVDHWATDELLANFFRITCPYLYQINALAYFALRRGQHGHLAMSRIRETTQVLIDIYHVGGKTYIQPLKVWGRYSQQMFLPHLITVEGWEPVSRSVDAAVILTSAKKRPLGSTPESIAPWDAVLRKLELQVESGADQKVITPEIRALKESLSRMMIGNHKKLVQLSDRYLTIDDLLEIRRRIIGSGRIGGKAAGMLLARSVLRAQNSRIDFSGILEEHDSFYIGSDVYFTFLVNNDLFRHRLELTKRGRISWEEFAALEAKFLEGSFPQEIMEQFRGMIEYYGQAPIIVRSSSLLEDGFTDAFAGKYRSEFCVNQGNPEQRLEAFLQALKLVYASSLNPDALAYRQRRGLNEGDEQMAVLVQRVSGMPFNDYFFPVLAGVAFSRNLFAWTERIDPSRGMIRLVFGLGTRAVNRVSGDYPRMIAVSHPGIRPEVGREIARYSQRLVDALSLEKNTLVTVPFTDIVKAGHYPALHLIASDVTEGYPRDWFTGLPGEPDQNLVLTFNNLIRQTSLVSIIEEILTTLEEAWGQPVDIEFTAFPDSRQNIRINLLQCRALRVPVQSGVQISLPRHLSPEQVLFRSGRAISAGAVNNISHIIYIDPSAYAAADTVNVKSYLGRAVGKLNKYLGSRGCRVMLMGPGRWGSNNIHLGVNVGFADIDGMAVLVEIAHEASGHTPEVSYGTHFFQDLVESNILYLPVYPGDPGAEFNTAFFSRSPGILGQLLPELGRFEDVIKVIEVPAVSNGAFAAVSIDAHTRDAVCFLEKEEQ